MCHRFPVVFLRGTVEAVENIREAVELYLETDDKNVN